MSKWITQITYGAFEGQAIDMTGFDVTFSGAPLDRTSHDFADAIAKIILYPVRSHALRIRGTFPATDTSVYEFVKRFRDEGWFIVAISDGQSVPIWMDFLGYHIVSLARPEWTVIRCNELWWRGATGPEPMIPTPPPKLMLDTTGMDERAVWHWLEEAKRPWDIATERKRTFRKVVA